MAANSPQIFVDLSIPELIEQALSRGEGILASNGALVTETGKRTGRSPKDRFIVKDEVTQAQVAWGEVNRPTDATRFAKLWQRAEQHLATRDRFVSHLTVGADPEYSVAVEVTTETAWHNLFAGNMFIRQSGESLPLERQWTLLHAPSLITEPERDGCHSDACLMINFSERKILQCGLRYAGEIKKSMFSVLNYLCPQQDILPMHCAANVGKSGDVALFFGLSGTGKTTLSADPDRFLIGDDEHGWHQDGVFNFEGGCYAKCIDLSKAKEPMIWDALRFGAIMENVVLDEQRQANYADASLTQNTRAAYPRTHIDNCVIENRAGKPSAVIFLTCDLYGVLPPVSLLTAEQAAYHFLSGYTALVGSTEVGNAAGSIAPTFSTCFGAPFFPRPASVYAELLLKRVQETGAQVYLVNTGWTGGGYGQGQRFSIPTSRAVISAILNRQINAEDTETVGCFHLRIPKQLAGVDTQLLNPVNTWTNKQAYQESEQLLAEKFVENFKQFAVADNILAAGPSLVENFVCNQ